MGWLVRGDDVLCSCRVASSARSRARGLLGAGSVEGAVWLAPCRSVHTLGMRFAIDVGFLDARGTVIDVVCPMRPWRVGRARWKARAVVEASAGSFERWGLSIGDVLEVR